MNSSRLFSIYGTLPIWLQNVACSLTGFQMRHERYNRKFKDTLAFLRESQNWSLERQKEYQNAQLVHIINHAYATVPYYHELFDNLHIAPTDIQTVDDLPKLPILDKTTIRQRFADLQSQGFPSHRKRHGHTGGTTGTSLQLTFDIDTQSWQWAVWWRHRERFGIKLHDPFIVFAGRDVLPLTSFKPPIWRRNLPMHQTYISVHHLTKQNLPVVADYLCRRKVKYYSGYPSALYLVARYFLDNSIRLPNPPSVVVTGAETLLPHQRSVICTAFDTEVADQYGASEYCGNISECEKHSYHLDFEYGAIEFLPMQNMPPDVRRIICTGFRNMAMPLIRYDIGDIATVKDISCSCGRQSQVIDKIDGRIESYILTPDGRQLGRLDFLFKDSHNIEEAQLIQHIPDSVTVRIVRSSAYTINDETALIQDMRKYLGDQIAITTEYVSSIPREANGKFRQIISKVFRDKYAQHQE